MAADDTAVTLWLLEQVGRLGRLLDKFFLLGGGGGGGGASGF